MDLLLIMLVSQIVPPSSLDLTVTESVTVLEELNVIDVQENVLMDVMTDMEEGIVV